MSKRSAKHEPAVEAKASRMPAWISRLDSDRCAVLAIIAIWVAAVLLINPKGNFPLNDDWCYGKAVMNLLQHHEIKFIGIVTMTLVAQVVWGALFCKLLGPTFTSLRYSTLTLALAGLLAVFGLLREARVPRWVAVIGCLVIGLNPLYLSLSYTFMTDVPFAALALISLYAYVRALKTDSVAMIAVGTLLACVAVLVRQLGIILPIAFGLAYLVKNGVRLRIILKAFAPIAIVAAVLLGYQHWLSGTHKLPGFYNIQAGAAKTYLSQGFVPCLLGMLKVKRMVYVYLGLFLLPFLIITISRKWSVLTSRQRAVNLCISLASAVIVMGTLVREHRWMPINHAAGDIISDFGIGPPTLRDVFVLNIPNYLRAPESFWIIVTVAGVIGGALLTWHVLAAIEALMNRDESVSPFEKGFIVLMLSATVMFLAPMVPLTASIYFDRYILCAIPLMMVLAALTADSFFKLNRLYLAVALITLVFIGMYSVAGTHDYLAWNRARWQALNDLTHIGQVQPNEVDGGYEFNGWHNYVEGDKEQRWWRDVYDDYIITFGPVPGYDEEKTYTYRRWMPLGDASIYVLSKSVL